MSAADEEVRITLRLPALLRDRLATAATDSGRSMNGEIVLRLQGTFDEPVFDVRTEAIRAIVKQAVDGLQSATAEISQQVAALRQMNEQPAKSGQELPKAAKG